MALLLILMLLFGSFYASLFPHNIHFLRMPVKWFQVRLRRIRQTTQPIRLAHRELLFDPVVPTEFFLPIPFPVLHLLFCEFSCVNVHFFFIFSDFFPFLSLLNIYYVLYVGLKQGPGLSRSPFSARYSLLFATSGDQAINLSPWNSGFWFLDGERVELPSHKPDVLARESNTFVCLSVLWRIASQWCWCQPGIIERRMRTSSVAAVEMLAVSGQMRSGPFDYINL